MSAGGLFSGVAKWAAIEHRLATLETKIAVNDAKIAQLMQGVVERVIALEAERRTIDAKIAGIGSEARGAAAAASTIASTAATHPLLERIIKLEIEVSALRQHMHDDAASQPSLERPAA